eukprot:TRINITY_DN6613_c0_g1_i2.p1 TRINITY_DN6613_c0_g1~~TRINITY_DN6613_c0_g1_i2.p1  ORF type:complete len:556 (+),score=158.09 TRINITY_DN6613_c0_g1_i2:83-1669(+)
MCIRDSPESLQFGKVIEKMKNSILENTNDIDRYFTHTRFEKVDAEFCAIAERILRVYTFLSKQGVPSPAAFQIKYAEVWKLIMNDEYKAAEEGEGLKGLCQLIDVDVNYVRESLFGPTSTYFDRHLNSRQRIVEKLHEILLYTDTRTHILDLEAFARDYLTQNKYSIAKVLERELEESIPSDPNAIPEGLEEKRKKLLKKLNKTWKIFDNIPKKYPEFTEIRKGLNVDEVLKKLVYEPNAIEYCVRVEKLIRKTEKFLKKCNKLCEKTMEFIDDDRVEFRSSMKDRMIYVEEQLRQKYYSGSLFDIVEELFKQLHNAIYTKKNIVDSLGEYLDRELEQVLEAQAGGNESLERTRRLLQERRLQDEARRRAELAHRQSKTRTGLGIEDLANKFKIPILPYRYNAGYLVLREVFGDISNYSKKWGITEFDTAFFYYIDRNFYLITWMKVKEDDRDRKGKVMHLVYGKKFDKKLVEIDEERVRRAFNLKKFKDKGKFVEIKFDDENVKYHNIHTKFMMSLHGLATGKKIGK